jgi:hypothetical protein
VVDDPQAAVAVPDFVVGAQSSKPAAASASRGTEERSALAKKSDDITKIREKHAQEAASSACVPRPSPSARWMTDSCLQ